MEMSTKLPGLHGMPRITVAVPAMAGSGFTSGPAAMAAASHPPVTAMTAAA